MKRVIYTALPLLLAAALLAGIPGCTYRQETPVIPVSPNAEATAAPATAKPISPAPSATPMPTEVPTPSPAPTATPTPEPTATPTPEPTAAPAHSPLYIEGQSVEDVIAFFNEVCLDSEWVNGGDPSLVQKWAAPIRYMIHGTPTQTDGDVLAGMMQTLSGIYGFPGCSETQDPAQANLNIYFCSQQELQQRMGSNADDENLEGAITFWYDGMNQIYDAIICIRNDIDQTTRSSVILEEIYNGLGPVQDTQLREDSIIYQYSSASQALTDVDLLILKLLYHPDMYCGLNAAQAESVIRNLYY